MRRLLICTALLAAAWACSIAYAQTTKISNAQDYSKAMNAIFFDFATGNYSIVANDLAGARKSVASSRARMVAIQEFWVEKKKDGPAMIAKTALEKLDAYEKAIATGDRNVMAAAVKEAVAPCGSCHAQYRDQDPVTKDYRIKPGVL